MGGVIQESPRGRVAALALAVSVALSSGGCNTPKADELDLAENVVLCPDTGYRARFPGDREVFVAPVSDGRAEYAATAEASAGPYPIQWMPETVWPRPMADMVEDVLRRELVAAGVFTAVAAGEPPPDDAVVLRARLLEGRAGREEQVGGRRTLARFAMRVVAQGPVGADGERPVLYDRVHERDAATDAQFRPARVPVIYGGAVATAVAELLASLDRAGVGRSAGAPAVTEPERPTDDWDWSRDARTR